MKRPPAALTSVSAQVPHTVSAAAKTRGTDIYTKTVHDVCVWHKEQLLP